MNVTTKQLTAIAILSGVASTLSLMIELVGLPATLILLVGIAIGALGVRGFDRLRT